MDTQTLDLSQLFRVAQEAMAANRQQINAMDGYNGNHGDNMVENLRVIAEALQAKQSQTPAQALRYASKRLAKNGRGGTSQYYTQGLRQAAKKVEGQASLGTQDVMAMLETLLGAIPAEAAPQSGGAAESVLDTVAGLALKQQAEARPQPAEEAFDLGAVVERLLPVGMALLQARQSGGDSSQAVQQALIRALLWGQVQPQQANTPRAAAGSLIAQTMLQALMGRK